MKKILIMAGALVLSTTAFADLKSTITNQYKNNELTINIASALNKRTSTTSEVAPTDNAAASVRDRIITFAQTKLGSPYVWGATGPNSFDCSGFVGYVFKNAANVNLPRVSSSQATFRPRISSMNMKKGDLLFFETTGKGRISHVGIYMGNGQFIHASSGSKRVTVSSLDSNFYSKTFRWAINPFS
ncbi:MULTISPECIES: C40 family peptidase [unclassified Leptotrichia]|uniref:C40 family peptidase n=1 Tax=unclassified Leptotrichia TaxID=2633022 RepID=UPI00180CC533|nr:MULTISPECIES: C40 family peptidase [unclassified Leptotrichia]MBB1534439.1 C40 family peptidase [Leptotrichia sp.]QUB96608.1 C40 family peptidase [Leptotrichia sp. oral taxon 221]